jgi:hypothetical protein
MKQELQSVEFDVEPSASALAVEPSASDVTVEAFR